MTLPFDSAGEALDSVLAVAIERQQWEVAALCLMLAAVRLTEGLPPEAIEALLDELSGPARPDHASRRGRRRVRRR